VAKLTDDIKKDIVAKWKAGWTQGNLAKEFEVSKATINKLCKNVEQENIEIVNAQIAVKTQLAGKSEQEVNAITQVVDERTKHIDFFNNSLLKNQSLVNKAHNQIEKDIEDNPNLAPTYLPAINTASQATARNRESILGKNPDTQVNIQNNNTVVSLTLEDFYEE